MAGQPTQMQPTLPQSAHKNAFRALGGKSHTAGKSRFCRCLYPISDMISEAGRTSRKEFPIGARLKSTRPIYMRLYPMPNQPQAGQKNRRPRGFRCARCCCGQCRPKNNSVLPDTRRQRIVLCVFLHATRRSPVRHRASLLRGALVSRRAAAQAARGTVRTSTRRFWSRSFHRCVTPSARRSAHRNRRC